MSFDAFMIFGEPGDGAIKISGETMDTQMSKKGAFEIDSFSFGIENTLNIGSKSGGAGAGKVQFNEFQVEKVTDKGSPGLFHTCCCGGHYKDAELILRRAGGDKTKSGTPYLVFKFKLVAVKSIEWSGADGDENCKETVVFEYGAIRIEYTGQSATGGVGATDEKEWSRVKNEATFTV